MTIWVSTGFWKISLIYTECGENVNQRIAACESEAVKIKSLKPIGYVMHQQFNIQQVYALPTLCLCVLYLSESKQRLVPLTA